MEKSFTFNVIIRKPKSALCTYYIQKSIHKNN